MSETLHTAWVIELWIRRSETWLPAHMYISRLNPIRERYLESYVEEWGLDSDNVRIKRIRTCDNFRHVSETFDAYPAAHPRPGRLLFPATDIPKTGTKVHFDDGCITLNCTVKEE